MVKNPVHKQNGSNNPTMTGINIYSNSDSKSILKTQAQGSSPPSQYPCWIPQLNLEHYQLHELCMWVHICVCMSQTMPLLLLLPGKGLRGRKEIKQCCALETFL